MRRPGWLSTGDGDETVVGTVGALGALGGVAASVLVGLDGNPLLWASVGAVLGLLVGVFVAESRAD